MSFAVTIDGPAAAGKSTTARGVASRLGFLYVDTGALYRAIALKVQQGGIPPDDRDAVERLARETQVALSGAPDHPRVWLDGAEVSDEIRTPAVSELSSRLAAQPAVRRRLIEIQRALRDRGPLVAEGRDLGTVVFPDAEIKVYLDADLDTRARRRFRERERLGLPMTLDEVRDELERRDARDRGRSESPLAVPEGARVLDTSGMTVADQIEAVLAVVASHPAFPAGPGCPGGRADDPVRERSEGGAGD
ncbi:MAG: (d)CMP kinase [Candidatus Eisenbacteria bacterium]|uniref:Cytidylate kinase n=1 Tax=Eiseniibacteriota bacterium TaxID=2212470 RepID=A0A9D6LCE1_UNCEI|nr:(d)CMP kinase [Candidatus Eisenbacteria bacterium]MBI3540134.1 (d)CMP kinase [Candidatus Eisenbacteria bacterium]